MKAWPIRRLAAIGTVCAVSAATATACGSPDAQVNCPGPTTATIIVNAENVDGLPVNFHTLPDSAAVLSANGMPTGGLSNLKVASSHAFSLKQLQAAYKQLKASPKNVRILDLRRESHGFFGGNVVEWYGPMNGLNNNKSIPEIITEETQQLGSMTATTPVYSIVELCKADASIGQAAQVNPPGPLGPGVTEETSVQAQGSQYSRIFAADYQPLTSAQIDEFLAIYRPKPKNTWLYVHAASTAKRTGMVLVMIDMLSNANSLSIQDIANRQAKLSGANSMTPAHDTFYAQADEQRVQTLNAFYKYSQQFPLGAVNPPTFTAWLAANPGATASP